MADAPQMNTPEARTETGEIKDQGTPLTPTETKADETKEPAAGAETKPAAAPAVPESYADFTVPEGFELDKTAVDAAAPIFKELGLDQAGAQKLVDFYTKQIGSKVDSDKAAIAKQHEAWRTELAADKDIGSKLPEVQSEIGKALTQLPAEVSGSFREAMNFTGLGDHPAIVKTIYEFAKLINEGKHVAGLNPAPAGQQRPGTTDRPGAAKSMYPNLA